MKFHKQKWDKNGQKKNILNELSFYSFLINWNNLRLFHIHYKLRLLKDTYKRESEGTFLNGKPTLHKSRKWPPMTKDV